MTRKWKTKIPELVWPALLLMGCAFALYANTFGHAWTLDDFPVIVNNPDIRSLSGFLADIYPGRPLRELTYLLDYSLFGLNPAGWHIQNIFWHGLNAGLLFVLVLRLGGSRFVAWSVALLFLAHPAQVEVVANIANRKDSLALTCILLAILAYLRIFRSQRRLLWLTVAAIFLATGRLAKEHVAMLPLVWLGYESAFVAPRERLLLRYKPALALVAVAAVAGFFGWYFFAGGMAAHRSAMTAVMAKMTVYLEPDTVAPYALMALKSLTFMAGKLVWPLELSPEYVYPAPSGWLDPWVLGALGLLTGYGLMLWRLWRRWPLAFFALLWLGLFWLPTANLWPLSYFAADRYFYAPSVGAMLLTGLLAERGWSRKDHPSVRVAVLGLLICGLLVCGGLTWRQNRVWATPLALWRHAVQVTPESTSALNNLGAAYLELGQLEKSLDFFHKAAANFDSPMPYYNLGRVYERLGNHVRALYYYQKFLTFNDPERAPLARGLRLRLARQYGILLK